MTDTVDHGTSYPDQNDTRGDLISRVPPFQTTRWVPRIMATGGSCTLEDRRITFQRERPALLPRHYGFNDTIHYSDATATTPSGTTRQRDLHQQLRRTPRAPEPDLPQRQELNTVFNKTTVRDDTKDTPEGSTETLVVHYTAGRVLSTATPPHRVLFISDPTLFDYATTTPTPSSTSTSALDTERSYSTPRMHRKGQPREE